ncbi:hypothetical protein D3C72_1991750 [compost metagenome]
MILAACDNGGVWRGSLEPNTATWGRFSAAVTCIRPESLQTAASESASRSTASSSEVWPHRLRTNGASLTISAAISASLAEPSVIICAYG